MKRGPLLFALSLAGCGSGGDPSTQNTGAGSYGGTSSFPTGGAGGTGGTNLSGAGGVCAGGAASAGVSQNPSCAGGLLCGQDCISCCAREAVPGGTFTQGTVKDLFDNMRPATVSPFLLDTFEVTVGRFRKFVEAYPATKPKEGAGAHPLIPGSGWQPMWNANLPTNQSELLTSLRCQVAFIGDPTWTDDPGLNESKPINCLTWYLAFAFCAWDGGRLATEAEWECAASGCGEQRQYPWGDAPIDAMHAVIPRDLGTNAPNPMPPLNRIATVGSVPLGNGKWGHRDMSGNAAEWVLDVYDYYPKGSSCVDCANLGDGLKGDPPLPRGARGGGVYGKGGFKAAERGESDQSFANLTVRCARSPSPTP